MRKPLSVVCGVTVVVLVAGGVAATSAGADETPGRLAMAGLQLPGLPNFPHFPWMTGSDGGSNGSGSNGSGSNGSGSNGSGTNRTAGNDRFPDRPAAPAAGRGRTIDGRGRVATAGDAGHTTAGHAGHAGHTTAGDAGHAGHTTAGDRMPRRPGGAGTRRRATGRQGAARPAAARAAQTQTSAALTTAAQKKVSPAQVTASATAPFQQQVLALINQNRRRGGCGRLTLDRRLIRAAFDHARDMAHRDYFAHESPNGNGPGDRVTDAGFRWSRYGENIARGPSSAYEVVNGWMHSPGHRQNIMDCRFREMGIGLAFGGGRESYWVQDFGTPRT